MQTALTYRTNRDLFSNYYLDEHLPETEAWDELSDDELREAKADIMDLWEREKGTAPKRNESQLEEKFIRPMFRKLGIPFEVEESTSRTQRRPDYGFFESDDAAREAFERREEGGDFYQGAVAVADAKRWGRPLDTRGSGEHERDFENPSYQIHVYLQEVDDAQWAVLTDGKKWRLYYGPTSHRLDSYYEIDLPTVLEKGDLEDFKYFYLFFRHGAFLENSSGECFLDEVYDESNVFSQELGEDLQDNIYEAIKVLSEGFIQYPDNDLSQDDLDLIHDSSLIYLYRLIFVLYAESEGRDLLDTNNEIYEESYSLNTLKQDVAEELDSPNPKYRDWQDNLWDRLDELFKLIDQGSQSRGIPEEDLYIPAYNGGLFRTDPDEDDSVEARFLANHQVGDAYLAEVIELLTRSQNGNGGGKIFVDYSSLDVRHLGSIYEGLLEYQLDVADEPLALVDGEYVPAGEGDEVIVEEGEVHLTTGSGERKATGSYYTPEYVVEYIVEETLEPLVDDIRSSLVGQSAFDEGGFAAEFAEEVFNLKILDPAMGSGHFLTSAIDYLAREIIDAQERQAAQEGIETVDEEHDINWARRQVAQRCIYGVDLNPLAVELAKVSLWLRTLAAEQPLAFLDHHLKTGNSLVGSDIEEIEELESDAGTDGQNASLADFGVARKGTIEQLMRIYEDFIAIENQELTDVKKMESKYDEFERNKLRQRLEEMANVKTAERLGVVDPPADAYKRMASALEDNDEWETISEMDWYTTSQDSALENHYFHWRLEYPEVFYNKDGNERNEPGFDAVIGNPPYVESKQLSKREKERISSFFESTSGKFDLYIPFTELSIELSVNRVGYIIPSMFTKREYGKGLREYISKNTAIDTFVDFEDMQVFGDITNFTGIFVFDHNSQDEIRYLNVPDSPYELMQFATADSEHYSTHVQNNISSEPWSFQSQKSKQIIDKITSVDKVLEDYTEAISVGIQTGKDDVFLISEDDFTEYGFSSDIWRKLVRGRDVNRWGVPQTNTRVFYPYNDQNEVLSEKVLESEYPDTYEYLKKQREKLAGREYFEKSNKNWYELWCPRDVNLFTTHPKILVQEIASENTFTVDESGMFFNTKVFGIIHEELSTEFLAAVLNSKVCEFEFKTRSVPKRGGYYEYKTQYLKNIPIAVPDDPNEIERIGDLYEEVRNYTTELESLNLNLLDYLGISVEEGIPENMRGDSLGELYVPPSGLAESQFSKTGSELDSLRLDSVNIEQEDNKTVIYAQARYKPEDPDQYETDRWGYTETTPEPIMEFIGLNKKQRSLIESFVPVAVEEGGGFANFRESATKTKSLVDRLENLVLPNTESIESGLERFIDIKERSDYLKEEISGIEGDLDRIFYELYGLTDEEIVTVEEHLEGDD
ncbi:Eco57I restriction-modification methylase domain-containing protein [Halobellus rarus]|uniref:site-specific DNA-methyltransferase (adenine-specific) n=1 Tax=Halobellus rarus TaxID=1126237 RepID=A0ABD6CUC2_9EURY